VSRGGPDLDTVFVRWTWCRAVLHRGWWLVTSVYLVADARLPASELVLIGVAQGVVALVFEVPAGVVADTVSRKWSLVVSHVLMGTSMIATGLVTGFGALVATQMVWGLSWTFASGADVAWISDEIREPARVALALLRSGRAQLTGAVAGMVGVGGLAWLTQRRTAMVLAGAAMLLLGLYVAFRFRERRFAPGLRSGVSGVPPQPGAAASRWSVSWRILVRGLALARRSEVILVMFAATFLVTGVAGVFGRLYPLRLVHIGLPTDPVAWLTALGVLSFLGGAVALRVAQPYVDGTLTVRRCYVVACGVGAAGVVGLVGAPEDVSASVAVLLAAGALPLTRTFGTIWVNRETSDEVRATVHSLLAQAEHLGAVVCGLAVAAVARFAGLPAALVICGAMLTVTIILVRFGGIDRARRH